jgi:hypothetical protein
MTGGSPVVLAVVGKRVGSSASEASTERGVRGRTRLKPTASLTGCEGAVIRPLFSVSCDSFATTRRIADQGAPEGAPYKWHF